MEQNKSFLDMHQSEQLDQLFTALCKAQGEMGTASKSSDHPFLKMKYANLTEIITTSRPCLKNNGLSIDQQIITHDNQDYLVTSLGHSSGQWKRSFVAIRPAKNDIQAFGCAITYLRRYSYAALIGMVADEDDDGQGAMPVNAAKIIQNTDARKSTIPLNGPSITKEQYELLSHEIGHRVDIVERILERYKIDDLHYLPKAYFQVVLDAVRNNKKGE